MGERRRLVEHRKAFGDVFPFLARERRAMDERHPRIQGGGPAFGVPRFSTAGSQRKRHHRARVRAWIRTCRHNAQMAIRSR